MKKLCILICIPVLLAGCAKKENLQEQGTSAASPKTGQAGVLAYNLINNGVTWNVSGTSQQIKAQGGNIIKVGSTYHWFGHDFTGGTSFKAINHYTSTNMASWANAGPAFTNAAGGDYLLNPSGGHIFPFSGFVGRPYVMQKNGGGFVMALSFNSGGSRNTYTFLTASSINGPWTYNVNLDVDRMDDKNGRACSLGDLGAYYDASTGTGYVVYTFDDGFQTGTANEFFAIRRLNTACTSPLSNNLDFVQFAKVATSEGDGIAGREAASIFKRDGVYYYTASGTRGWQGSTCWYRTSGHLPNGTTSSYAQASSWSASHPINTSPASSTSFNTQHDQILALGNDADYLYCGDRWPDGNVGPGGADASHPWPARNAWYPVTFTTDPNGGDPVPTINAPNYGTNGGDWKIDLAAIPWWIDAP